MKTLYTNTNELKGQELDNIFSLLSLEYANSDIGISNMFRYLDTQVNSVPMNITEYNDLWEVPFTLAQINQYIQSLGITAAVKRDFIVGENVWKGGVLCNIIEVSMYGVVVFNPKTNEEIEVHKNHVSHTT